ncbi:hypothetical protein LZ31DRAFT_353278 [Colletotrichum somersetense]|nr:hypothetical protein LZ31DRAFT_353278 [Colletotrichum somersetense]
MGSVVSKVDEPWSLCLLFRPPPQSMVGRTTGSRGLRMPRTLKEGVTAAVSSPACWLASSSWSLARRRSAHFLMPSQAQKISMLPSRKAQKMPSTARIATPMISATAFKVGGGAMAMRWWVVLNLFWSWLEKTMVAFLFLFLKWDRGNQRCGRRVSECRF